MAYTATITKERVSQSGTNYNVSLKVVINDGATDVLDFTANAKYNPNAPDMSGIMSALQTQIKDKWDEYVSTQGVFNAAVLDGGVSTLQTQVNAYIN
jgi:hypothetical protein